MDSCSLKQRFVNDVIKARESERDFEVLTTAVRLPTGAIEVSTNSTHIDDKIDYITYAYDDDFKLRTNSKVEIVGFMLV